MRFLRSTWPLALAAALMLTSRLATGAMEMLYARRVYPVIAEVLGAPARAYHALTSSLGLRGRFVPSLSELLIVALLVFVGRGIVRAMRAPDGPDLVSAALACARGVGWGALVFVVAWGLNHSRRDLLHSFGWTRAPMQAADLERVALRLAEAAAAARSELAEDQRGVVVAPADYGVRAAAAWRATGAANPWLRGATPLVVEPAASGLLIAAQVSGIFSPFTGEAHVARGLPPISRGFTACHELAHRMGFAREDEANALAFYVGIESSDPYLRCSAATLAFAYVATTLNALDPERWRAVALACSPGLARDLDDQRAFWRRDRGAVAKRFGQLATATNDAYLRSMGTADGVASYGRMVDFVLAWDQAHRARRE
ncbi:MAG: DUF3810 domain-containing protein [Planctomycetota bacterium]